MFKQIVFKYDNSPTGSFTSTVTAYCNSVVVEPEIKKLDTFESGNGYTYQTSVSKLRINLNVSAVNFENSDSFFVDVMKFVSAPFKRVYYMPSSTYPTLNGYSDFSNTAHTINLILDDHSVNWNTNKRYRSISMELITEQPYTG